jgi:signal transduction histidine kinase
MDHLQKFTSQFRTGLFFAMLLNSLLTFSIWRLIHSYLWSSKFENQNILFISMTFVIAFLSAALMSWLASIYLVKPVRFIWETVLHIAPDAANTPAPDPKKVLVGREFVTTLAANIYQIANVADNVKKLASKTQNNLKSEFVANSLTMPLVVLDKEVNIIFANKALLEYVSRTEEDTIGQNVYTVLDFMFSNDNTFDSWLEQARSNKVTATKTWERVRLNLSEQKLPDHYCDLVAYYNKNNPEGFEIMLMLFDRTRQYSQDEQAMSFVALMAHESCCPTVSGFYYQYLKCYTL